MLKIPVEDIIYKIEEKTALPRSEIDKRIDEKLKALFGLVSREGAAHIVANELGVKLFDSPMGGKLAVRSLMAGMRNVELHGVVRRVYEARAFKTPQREGTVGSFLLGDETGLVRIVLWNDQAAKLSQLAEGSQVKLTGGTVKERNNFKEVHLGERSTLEVSSKPLEVRKAEFPRRQIGKLTDQDETAELLGAIVQVFDLKFFEICPTCGKRAKPMESAFFCEVHGTVVPQHTAVLNLFLDDGSESIRVVCFRRQLARLLPGADLDAVRQEPARFEAMRHELLGSMLKVSGRIVKNPMFDRLEMIASLIYLNPDPQPEIERLAEEQGAKVMPPPAEHTEEPLESEGEDIIKDDGVVDE